MSARTPARPPGRSGYMAGFCRCAGQSAAGRQFCAVGFYSGAILSDPGALSGRDDALRELNAKAAELAELLAMEKAAGLELRSEVARLSSALQSTSKELDTKTRATADAQQTIAQLRDLVLQREGAVAAAPAVKWRTHRAAWKLEKQVSLQAQAQVKLLNEQIAALREQLAQIATALDAAEAKDKENQVVIADLGARLNQALAAKVEELARYRSEFFGRSARSAGQHAGGANRRRSIYLSVRGAVCVRFRRYWRGGAGTVA